MDRPDVFASLRGNAATSDGLLAAGRAALEVEALGKTYERQEVLRGIGLAVRAGEIVGLLGRDGAGKTLCFDLIMGFVRQDAGRVWLRGTDVSRWSVERRARLGLSLLPQEASVFRDMTVEQNIATVLEIRVARKSARAARLEQILHEFQLGDLRTTPAIHLSGGERRRCEIARAVAADPVVLLMDEPFAGIDPLAIASIQRSILSLRAKKVGLLVSDQNLPELLDIMDRSYVLHEGRVLFEGSPSMMLADPRVRELYLGEDFERRDPEKARSGCTLPDRLEPGSRAGVRAVDIFRRTAGGPAADGAFVAQGLAGPACGCVQLPIRSAWRG